MYLVGEFGPKKTILWHAGASSVSIAGIQLSKADSAAAIYVTAGSQEKIDFCVKELGATAGFNYHTQDWAKEDSSRRRMGRAWMSLLISLGRITSRGI